jgi:hypothetical protein
MSRVVGVACFCVDFTGAVEVTESSIVRLAMAGISGGIMTDRLDRPRSGGKYEEVGASSTDSRPGSA